MAGDAQSLTLWEVLDNRAYHRCRASPDATRRWLGLALGRDDLVAILLGRASAPLTDPTRCELVAPDEHRPVAPAHRTPTASSASGSTRQTGRRSQVEWTGGKNPARVTFTPTPPEAPPAGLDARDARTASCDVLGDATATPG